MAPSATPASSVIATDESTLASSCRARQKAKESPPPPAVFVRERQPEQAQLAHLRDDLVRKFAALVESADHRRDHLAGELGDRGPEVFVLLVEHETDHAC